MADSRRHIALIGMPGVGKSATGLALAQELGLPFADTDALIETQANADIATVFARYGESRFRTLEREAVDEVCAHTSPRIISTGGGAPMTPEVFTTLRKHATVVWLRANMATLHARTADGQRPLLQAATTSALGTPSALARPTPVGSERLHALSGARAPTYRNLADLIIDTDDRSPAETATMLATLLQDVIRVHVELGKRRYHMAVANGALRRLGAYVRATGYRGDQVVVVTDRNVAEFYGPAAKAALAQADLRAHMVRLPAGERSKCMRTIEHIGNFMNEVGADRQTLIIGLGGGVVTDIAGFAAGCYQRGIDWIAVPTTWIGMIDAALGGKTGVNLAVAKNQLGLFHQPRMVVADPATLHTLPDDERVCGLGELFKCALIGSRQLCDLVNDEWLNVVEPKPDLRVATQLVRATATFKADVVSADAHEHGRRQVLNFGHSVGHALEAVCGGQLTHGVAVVYGMRIALRLSIDCGLLDHDKGTDLLAWLDQVPWPALPTGIAVAAVLQAASNDKKNRDGTLRFVLLEAQGRARIGVEISTEQLARSLTAAFADYC